MDKPVACTLTDADAVDRSSAWSAVLVHVTEREATATGGRLRLPADPALVARAADLCVREVACCAFFTFSLTVDADGVWLDVATPREARDIVTALFGQGAGEAEVREHDGLEPGDRADAVAGEGERQ
jgi:hypothetical protein